MQLSLLRPVGRPRKRPEERKGHLPRPVLASRFPVHVTLKVQAGLPSLRGRQCFAAVRAAFVAGKERFGFRLAHFTVQGNHLHLICEATDRRALSRGMQGLCIRIARGLNRALARQGAVFAERYHAHILRTPTEVRHALAYVLLNARRHAERPGFPAYPRGWIDERGSGAWFDGWSRPPHPLPIPAAMSPVVPATTWLLKVGWRRRGLIAPDETPGLRPR